MKVANTIKLHDEKAIKWWDREKQTVIERDDNVDGCSTMYNPESIEEQLPWNTIEKWNA